MTIRNYINAKLTQWGVTYSSDLIDSAFALNNVNGESELTKNSEKQANLIFYSIIPDFIFSTPKSVSEGGYSVSYDKDAVFKFYSMIASDLGLPDLISDKPKVKDITHRW